MSSASSHGTWTQRNRPRYSIVLGGHEHGQCSWHNDSRQGTPTSPQECLWIVGSVYVGHSGATTNYSRREAFASIRQALDRVVPFDNNHSVLIFGDWNTDPQRLQRIVHSWGHARALLTSPRVDRQTAVADHFVIRTSIRAEAQGQPPVPRAPTISRHHCLEATDRIAHPIIGIHSIQSPASIWATKRAILASNTARQAFIAAATHTNPDPVQCNTLRDEWSRLKAAATQLREWMVANNGSSTLTISTALYQTVEPISFAAARAMSGNSSRSAAVTPLYNSDGIVQYDPTSSCVSCKVTMDHWQPTPQVTRWTCNTGMIKDGDPLNPGDKRGIALINVGLKLVCKVLQMRIERFVETKQPAILRTGWVPQARRVCWTSSLTCRHHSAQTNAGLNTHVLFIDIRKAFDTVPVGALLWKLQNMGFPRRTLAFLKALYTSSSARARAGSLLSDPFPVQRGVRQGCPLSGLLFNLFINDILDGVAPITAPWTIRETPTPSEGLMYADDVAVFA
ncbi:hypothetical protein BASA81_017647 [Batrachochytrium salamandrivorans]|nr:hypothetical protein BASA81_017647 [Batrachochytrium salamandrivorans]